MLFVVVDLVLGRIVPKVYTPTRYGWDVPRNKTVTKSIEDTRGNFREVTVEYFKSGFKRWPKSDPTLPRVLIIGDSFTEMKYVNNGEEWYSYLEREFPRTLFYVFGGGGYGTLQEYMVLDDHVDEIGPQAIIWQFCSNDYANNYYNRDLGSYPFNNHFVRPYYEDGEIVYRLPLPLESLRRLSFTADQLLHRYDRRAKHEAVVDYPAYKKRRRERAKRMSDDEKAQRQLDKGNSIETTRVLMKKVKMRVGDIPVYLFNACSSFTDDDQEVCNYSMVICIKTIVSHLDQLRESGLQVKVENNGHWNLAGNEFAGIYLAQYFKRNGGLIP